MAGKENVRSQRLQNLLPGPGEENLLTPCLRHFGLGFSTYLQPVSPVKIPALFFYVVTGRRYVDKGFGSHTCSQTKHVLLGVRSTSRKPSKEFPTRASQECEVQTGCDFNMMAKSWSQTAGASTEQLSRKRKPKGRLVCSKLR